MCGILAPLEFCQNLVPPFCTYPKYPFLHCALFYILHLKIYQRYSLLSAKVFNSYKHLNYRSCIFSAVKISLLQTKCLKMYALFYIKCSIFCISKCGYLWKGWHDKLCTLFKENAFTGLRTWLNYLLFQVYFDNSRFERIIYAWYHDTISRIFTKVYTWKIVVVTHERKVIMVNISELFCFSKHYNSNFTKCSIS